jgi:hypothetical protein
LAGEISVTCACRAELRYTHATHARPRTDTPFKLKAIIVLLACSCSRNHTLRACIHPSGSGGSAGTKKARKQSSAPHLAACLPACLSRGTRERFLSVCWVINWAEISRFPDAYRTPLLPFQGTVLLLVGGARRVFDRAKQKAGARRGIPLCLPAKRKPKAIASACLCIMHACTKRQQCLCFLRFFLSFVFE